LGGIGVISWFNIFWFIFGITGWWLAFHMIGRYKKHLEEDLKSIEEDIKFVEELMRRNNK
jgi:hypothetical protein